MKYRLVTIIFSILFFNILYAQNGDVANKGAGLVDTTKKVSDGSDIFARIEIRKMDSMLNLLYVQNEHDDVQASVADCHGRSAGLQR